MPAIHRVVFAPARMGRLAGPVLLFLFAFATCYAQEEGWMAANGAKIHYRTFGSGAPLLIINGGPGLDCEGFIPLAKTLSDHNQTIVFDQRGTGQSAMDRVDSTTITMDLMVDDMERLREHLHIRRWIIFGQSFGGMMASYYTTKHPEAVAGLILSSSGGIDLALLRTVQARFNARLTPAQRDSVAYYSEKIAKGDTSYAAKWGRASALANAYLVNKSHAPEIAERLMHSNLEINALVFADLQRIHYNCAPGLATYSGPVLIIQGKEDIVDEDFAWKAHKALKNSRVVLLDHSSHYGWLDRPEAYFGEVRGFLAANGTAATVVK